MKVPLSMDFHPMLKGGAGRVHAKSAGRRLNNSAHLTSKKLLQTAASKITFAR
jgi:hypothetical protein